jgi:hypothetical protein
VFLQVEPNHVESLLSVSPKHIYLVTSKLNRTYKSLTAIALGAHVVTPLFAEACIDKVRPLTLLAGALLDAHRFADMQRSRVDDTPFILDENRCVVASRIAWQRSQVLTGVRAVRCSTRVFTGKTIHVVAPQLGAQSPSSTTAAEDLEKLMILLRLAGANVVTKLLPGMTRGRIDDGRMILDAVVVSSADVNAPVAAAAVEAAAWFKCPLVTRSWVVESIMSRSLQGFTGYAVHPGH